MKNVPSLSAIAFLSVLCAPTLQAGQELSPGKCILPAASPFDQGQHEFQVGVGAYFSINTQSETRPQLNDADLNLRLGWMLYSPSGTGVCRGNLELLGEAFGAGVIEGPGTGFAGLGLLLRYNFVQPEAKCVPYFQLGAGGIYNDVYQSEPQRLLGQAFEFNLQGGLGLRWLASERCAWFAEVNFRHLSNADSADRNVGLNSIGGLVGASYFF